MSKLLSEKLFIAMAIALEAHKEQRRKGKFSTPYIIHPVIVGMQLLKLGYEEDVVIAGILHDLLEDGFPEKDREEVREIIKNNFGKNILEMVEALSEPKDPGMSRDERKRTWEERNQKKLEKLSNSSPEARAIAVVDIYANMLEMKKLFIDEGQKAKGYFNFPDFKKKKQHIEKMLKIFEEKDRNASYLETVDKIKEYLNELSRLLGEVQDEKNN
ncbi:MAG: HD domain-containing protein [Candidatus Saccharicenans sp.]